MREVAKTHKNAPPAVLDGVAVTFFHENASGEVPRREEAFLLMLSGCRPKDRDGSPAGLKTKTFLSPCTF
jgi:hypothetical protein